MLRLLPIRLAVLSTPLLLGSCGPEDPAPVRPRPASEDQAARALMFNGHDYLFIRSARSWWDAKVICESLGYGLVTVNDASEASWLRSLEGPHSWWLGYNDTLTEGVFRWSHGSSSYVAWQAGEPNNASNEDCIHDNWLGRSGWNDYPCEAAQYFICEALP